jgi:hypothetical protein
MLGSGGAVQRGEARVDGRDRRMPECRRNLHRVHNARIPRQIYAVYESAAGIVIIVVGGADLWTRHSCLAEVHAGVNE